ncbi:MAG TPA: GNAT family N-acetyltransferase, partial [Planctomycetia bacterium]|nr:GNAT family N-acetyltransferase [Planctomycetia bacterium]
SWFVLLAVTAADEIVGFAKGRRYSEPDLPDYAGELNKIYVLPGWYQRGIGRRLVVAVAERFREQGIDSMVLFSEPSNVRAGLFFTALGGQRILGPAGEFHGAYAWKNLGDSALQ